MRRSYLCVILIAVPIATAAILAGLAGCGSGADGDRQGTATTEADVIITFHSKGEGGALRQGIDGIVVQMNAGDEAFLSTPLMATHVRPDLTSEDFPIDRTGAPTTVAT